MRREWIIDVLADLRAFAEHNGLDATAAGLEDAGLVAVAEISSLARRAPVIETETIAVESGCRGANVADFCAYRGQL